MLHPDTLKFLSQLKKNNNKEWFDKNRDRYMEIRESFLEFTAGMIREMSRFDPRLAGLEPKQCVFRINRDVRFSKDKSPYKTNFAAAFSAGGKKFPGAGYYIHVSPDECFAGGGVWQPEPEMLKKVRQEIDYHAREFKKILSKPSFAKTFGALNEGDKLKTVPKGYDADNPNIALLKYKSYVCSTTFPAKNLLAKDAVKKCSALMKELSPFIQFLNQALD